MPKSSIDLLLKETCLLTGADWAVWLEREDGWVVRAASRLDSRQRSVLLKYLRLTRVTGWINGALLGNRDRSMNLASEIGLKSSKLFVFPDQVTQRVILVGAPELSSVARRFWRVTASGDYGPSFLNRVSAPASVASWPGTGIPSHSPEALSQALTLVMQSVGSSTGWLAVRSGDHLDVKVFSSGLESKERRISIEANPLLRQIVQERRPRLVEKRDVDWAMVPRLGFRSEAKIWAALPLVIGRRIIGLVGCWLDKPPETEAWERASRVVTGLAPSVEGSIVFDDLSNHLRRLALLNDFAVTISSAVDVEQIAQRLFALLQRVFETNRIILLVRSPEGYGFHQYYLGEDAIISQMMIPSGDSVFWPMEKGEILRLDSAPSENGYHTFYPNSSSALIVPLKYQRQVIGALGLESIKSGAFTIYDEHLVAVIASQLAGLLENGRLRQEAEARARNLSLIHDVVERVIGLNDVNQVAQIAAELMAKNFAYELAGVALFDGDNGLKLAGIGGSAASIVKPLLLGPEGGERQGIVGRVALTGQSLLANDVTEEPLYNLLPGWEAGSEMCVALKEGDSILGVIDVESRKKNAFSNNDLLVLESLAGILASVISNTGQYQKLQATVNQLQAARLELQERIAAQRMAESKLVQAAKLAAVGEMAAGIAHELNNPLTTVTGFTELAMENLLETELVRSDLELVLREAQRARGVVRRLLDFARQSESVRTRSDLNEIVLDVLALTNHLLATSGILIQTNLSDNLTWPSVDRNQIKQVMLNLIHNALHAMPAGGNLFVSTAACPRDGRDGIVISIRDTGIGIPPDHAGRVFEPFFTTRSKEGGTGLGLSVSYGIVVDHGGEIEVESKVGEGSSFTVWLPVEAG